MEPNLQDLMNLLPYIVRDKARAYLDYANDRLVDIALEEGAFDRIRGIRREANLIFMIRLLYGYFVVGFSNFSDMLQFFEEKGVDGFQIGSAAYSPDSSIVSDWQQVARELRSLINRNGLDEYVGPQSPLDMVIRRIIRTNTDIA